MTSVLGRRHHPSEQTAKAVRYTPCAKGDHTDEEELEEIAVLNQGDLQAVGASGSGRSPSNTGVPVGATAVPSHSGSPSTPRLGAASRDGCNEGPSVTANGPRTLPGTYTASSDRTKLIGGRLSASGRILHVTSPVCSAEHSSRATSRNSIFEMVSNKLDSVKGRGKSRSVSSREDMGYINKAHTVEPVTPRIVRKARRKEIENKFGKNKKGNDRFETSTTTSSVKDGCSWTFVFDPSGRMAYWWSAIVSVAFLYNFWVLVYRFAFEEINATNMAMWFALDYTADFIYVLDIVFHFRTGFLEDGVLQTESTRLRLHYMNSTMFYIDCLCLLPLDFLYLSIGFKSMLRCFRLVKIYRFWTFLDRTERHTNYPNVVRTVTLIHYLFAIYHWNACVMYLVTKGFNNYGVLSTSESASGPIGGDPNLASNPSLPGGVSGMLGSHVSYCDDTKWNVPNASSGVFIKYLHSLYLSTLTLTTIGDLPPPKATGEYVFVITEFVFGLLLFSTILGHVANIVTSISADRRDFQAKLDCVKTYMTLRRVPIRLQDRVIRWFDYLWLSKKSADEDKTMGLLPDKLKAEIALHVHLDTLKRVEIFQNTEAGFLCELVLRLRPVLFSPGDYICRKGEVGKEMYIVNRGRLQVVADNGKTVLATLRAGSYFGEISILNMGNAGNRRTASVRSVGYSDLFCLNKNCLWEVLKDYPTARVRLEAIAVKRLEKYKKQPLEKEAAIPRSKSTPGLLETSGKVPLEAMLISRHNTLPAGGLTPRDSFHGSHCSFHSRDPDDVDLGSYGSSSHRSRRSGEDDGDEGGGGGGLGGAMRAAQSTDITNSMTVSSITSYITESSAQKSPTATEGGRSPTLGSATGLGGAGGGSTHCPSPSRPTQGGNHGYFLSPAPSPFVPIEPGVSPLPPPHHQGGPSPAPPFRTSPMLPVGAGMMHLPQHLAQYPPPPPGAAGLPPGGLIAHTHQAASASPFHIVYQAPMAVGMPPQQLSAAAQSPPTHSSSVPHFLATTQTAYSSTSPHLNHSPGGSSGSSVPTAAASQQRDPQQEALVQEISRLRHRLHTLESENASMNMKLSQKHFEVDNRLAEIEMHFCESDTELDASGEETVSLNKESII